MHSIHFFFRYYSTWQYIGFHTKHWVFVFSLLIGCVVVIPAKVSNWFAIFFHRIIDIEPMPSCTLHSGKESNEFVRFLNLSPLRWGDDISRFFWLLFSQCWSCYVALCNVVLAGDKAEVFSTTFIGEAWNHLTFYFENPNDNLTSFSL